MVPCHRQANNFLLMGLEINYLVLALVGNRIIILEILSYECFFHSITSNNQCLFKALTRFDAAVSIAYENPNSTI